MIIFGPTGDPWFTKPATGGLVAVWRHEYLSQSRERRLVGDHAKSSDQNHAVVILAMGRPAVGLLG